MLAKRVGLGLGSRRFVGYLSSLFCDLTYVRAAVAQKQSAYAPKT